MYIKYNNKKPTSAKLLMVKIEDLTHSLKLLRTQWLNDKYNRKFIEFEGSKLKYELEKNVKKLNNIKGRFKVKNDEELLQLIKDSKFESDVISLL